MLARSWLNENFVNERFFSGVDYEGGLGDLSSRVLRIKLERPRRDFAKPFGAT